MREKDGEKGKGKTSHADTSTLIIDKGLETNHVSA